MYHAIFSLQIHYTCEKLEFNEINYVRYPILFQPSLTIFVSSLRRLLKVHAILMHFIFSLLTFDLDFRYRLIVNMHL